MITENKVPNRLKRFREYWTHPWFKRVIKKLGAADIAFAESWIKRHEHLDLNDFQFATNRMFLDDPNKPKKWTIIVELISNANTLRSEAA